MKGKILALCLACSLLICPATRALAGENGESTLRGFEQEVRERPEREPRPPAPPRPPRDPWDPWDPYRREKDDSFMQFVGTLFVLSVVAPFWLPVALLDDNLSRAPAYQAYPFALDNGVLDHENGRPGYFTLGLSRQSVSGSINAWRGEAHLVLGGRFNIEAALADYREELPGRVEKLRFSETLLTYTFAQDDNWSFRAGLGWERMSGVDEYDGLKAVYRVRTMRKPFQAGLDLGATFGSGSTLWEIAPRIGLHFNRLEIFAGYRQKKIAEAGLLGPGTSLRGPEFGARIWF